MSNDSLIQMIRMNFDVIVIAKEFLGVVRHFRLLVQSCCFFFVFFLPTFYENFKFLENCPYDFQEFLHTQSAPKGTSACAMASNNYDWKVRNIAKTSPKMVKKLPLFDFFRFSRKLFIRFKRNFLESFCKV